MLAKVFKSAAELGIPEHEAHALTTVLFMLEDGEIKPDHIYMGTWHVATSCGTAHCIGGWAFTVDNEAFPELKCPSMANIGKLQNRLPNELKALFGIHNLSMSRASPEQAAETLRHYLETGICNRKTMPE